MKEEYIMSVEDKERQDKLENGFNVDIIVKIRIDHESYANNIINAIEKLPEVQYAEFVDFD